MNKDNSAKKPLDAILDNSTTRMILLFVLVFAACSLLQGKNFLNRDNFLGMFKQFPEYGLLAIGIGMALIIGGIDLSAVYLANLASIVAGLFVLHFYEGNGEGGLGLVLISFVIAIVVGALGGILNGVLISGLGIPAMLATLGTQSLFWGFGVVLTGGSTLSRFPKCLGTMLNAKFFGILPVTVFIFAAGAIVTGIIVQKTKLGREMKMYGTNNTATSYSGLNNFKIVVLTHMFSGMLAALSGIIMWGRYSSAKADTGATYTMQAILIAVLGGVSPLGGSGSVTGIVLAVLIIQMLSSLLNMYTFIPTACRQIVWGGLLLVVMIINYYLDQRKKNRH